MTGMLLAILLGLVVGYLLSGLESAVVAVSHARLRHAAKDGDFIAKRLRSAFRNPQHLLITILVLNSTVNLLIFALVTQLFVGSFGPWGYLVSIAISLPVVLLWSEILPKAHFRRAPLRLLRRSFLLIWLLDWTLRPIVTLLGWLFSPLLRRSDTREQRDESREAFQNLTLIFERDGVLKPEETELIRNVLSFHRVRIHEVMRPLVDVETISSHVLVAEVFEISATSGRDQFPVSVNGDVIGLVDATRLLIRKADPARVVSEVLAEIVATTPDAYAIEVVKQLRRAGIQLAVVKDSENQPVGVVSVADLTEKMVRIAS